MSFISSTLFEKPGEIFNKVAKSKWMKGKLTQGVSDPARFAAAMFVTSIVSKDLIGCAFYTTQSLNNKKIPEEKRKFVAAVDLMNGIIMVGGQFLIGKVIDAKAAPWLKGKFTGQITDPITKKVTSINPNAILHPDNIRNLVVKSVEKMKIEVTPKEIENLVEKIGKTTSIPFANGFGILVTAIATTALTKRCLAPLISTPTAGWFKEHVMDKKTKKIQKDRHYYEAIAMDPNKYEHKLDKTAFSNVSSQNK